MFQVIRETGPLGEQTGYRWDRHDRLLARTDPLGHTTGYAYDEAGALASITRPDGRSRVFARDELGHPTAVTDFDGTRWPLTCDDRGNLLTDSTTGYTYDERGRLTSISDALGHVRAIACNAAGLPTTITDPLGATTRYDRDAFGRVTAVTDPLGNLTRLTWTVEGRLAGRVLPGGAEERWAYDAENNLIEHLDALGRRTRVEVGPFDLPAAQVTPDGMRIEFAYDTELRLTRVTNPSGSTWDYTYDPAGNPLRESDFDDRVLAYRHDRAGRLVERINGEGEVTSFVHDPLGRVIERRSGELTAAFGYDLLGRLVHAANADAEVRFGRDAYGRIVSETCNGRTLATTYDATGRRAGRRTPSGTESTWEYDAGGRLRTLRTGGRTIGFTHDLAGRETGRSLGPDTVLSHEWDTDSRLRAQTLHTGTSAPHGRGARIVQRRTYSYRPDAQLAEIDDLLAGRRRFELDPAGRVTDLSGPNWTEQYAYDPAGRLVHATGPGLTDTRGERSYTGTTVRRAGRVHLDHDRQGRVVLRRRKRLSGKDQIWRYTWDADDRLTTVVTPAGERWRYRYDALGRRIAKERADGSSRVEFVWDGPVLVEQIHDGRTTVWEWEPGTFRPVTQLELSGEQAELSGEQVDERFYAIVTDLIGSPAELVDPAGRVAWRSRNSLWGASTGPISAGADCPLRFPGQYADEESGLHYNLFRHYDPQTGAYLSTDPLGLGGGLVPHGYVLNPARWADPLGLSPYDPVPNRYPERLAGEKQAAAEAGVAPITAGTPEFGQAVKDGGFFLYSVEADDTLRIMTMAGDIKHPVMTDGRPVLAAGQVRFQYGSVTYIDNKTGHYTPERSFSEDFLQAGVRAFENAGIFVRRKAPRDIGEFS
ncbi:RHS repeat-associated protein [Nonomuraea thailandensis]|uniref:RHS repeat-associated protein n=1 Tax=Nonomuraea thailandensis TaxID=1188745 RepID=A0A9X2GXQ7_9ACTN|nr:RHS repeat-associated protein [Nonomuraea thailandensis]